MTAHPTPVESAVAVGRSLGLEVDEPRILKESLNLIVHLAPAPVVARVALLTARVRDIDSFGDSLALAAYLSGRGLLVTPPAEGVDPGPHVGPGGWRMTLWQKLDEVPGEPDPSEVGRSLRRLHEVAAGYGGPLRHVGPLEEIGRLARESHARRPRESAQLCAWLDRLDLPPAPVQALHGDSHLNNVFRTPAGHVWADWEEAWRGPVAWDLACLEHRRRVFGELVPEITTALEAYGPYDDAAVATWGDVIALWAAAWGILIAAETGKLGEGARGRLSWLERRFGSAAG